MTGGLTRRLARRLAAVGTIVVLTAGTIVVVKAADGDFASTYHLVGAFPAAGEGLHAGSEVDERGVQIGTVSSITLVGGKANVVLSIDDGYRLPDDVVATIRSQNLFGADDVSLAVPSGTPPGAPMLGNGGVIGHTAVEEDLGQLFASAAPLLSQLDTNDLAALISELSEAARGEGPAIAASLDEGTRLADLLSETSAAQLQALDAFARFSAAVSSVGPAINRISSDSNESLPLFTKAAAAYQTLLTDLGALSDHFSALLTGYEPDIATILQSGGNVSRLLIADQPDLEYLVYGLAQYAYRFAHAAPAATLPDGSRFGYFQTFVEWTDVVKLVCGLIAPDQSGLSFLAPLQSLVSTPGGPLDCSSEIAAFDKAQSILPQVPTTTTPPASAPGAPKSSKPGSTSLPVVSGLTPAAEKLLQQLYQELAVPQPVASTATSVGSYVQSLLGGGS
jgi:virulence factor Mce-like protein